MPSPAGFVVANVGNVQAVVVRLRVLQRLKSNPADFVIKFFGANKKFFGLGKMPFDHRLSGIFSFMRDMNLLQSPAMFVSIAFANFDWELIITKRAETSTERNNGRAIRALFNGCDA